MKIKPTHPSGKIANLVFVNRPGMPYVRSRPRKRKIPPTQGELLNRHLFKLVRLWLRPLYAVVRIGFRGYSEGFEGINAAVSQIHREALQRDGYASWVDASLVKISHGSLELPEAIEASLEGQEVLFTWDPGSDRKKDPHDKVMLAAYNVEAKRAVYKLFAAERWQGSARLSVEAAPEGVYHLYLAMLAADGNNRSNSNYVGIISKVPTVSQSFQ